HRLRRGASNIESNASPAPTSIPNLQPQSPTTLIERTLGRLAVGENLSLDETAAAIDDIMQGRWSEGQIALLLNGLRLKGETVDEIAGAALAMRCHMTPIASRREGVIDTCGTGGNSSGAFNISTTAALVA